MATYRPTMSEAARKNYSDLTEILKKISYKPGWKIKIVEEPKAFGFVVKSCTMATNQIMRRSLLSFLKARK